MLFLAHQLSLNNMNQQQQTQQQPPQVAPQLPTQPNQQTQNLPAQHPPHQPGPQINLGMISPQELELSFMNYIKLKTRNNELEISPESIRNLHQKMLESFYGSGVASTINQGFSNLPKIAQIQQPQGGFGGQAGGRIWPEGGLNRAQEQAGGLQGAQVQPRRPVVGFQKSPLLMNVKGSARVDQQLSELKEGSDGSNLGNLEQIGPKSPFQPAGKKVAKIGDMGDKTLFKTPQAQRRPPERAMNNFGTEKIPQNEKKVNEPQNPKTGPQEGDSQSNDDIGELAKSFAKVFEAI